MKRAIIIDKENNTDFRALVKKTKRGMSVQPEQLSNHDFDCGIFIGTVIELTPEAGNKIQRALKYRTYRKVTDIWIPI